MTRKRKQILPSRQKRIKRSQRLESTKMESYEGTRFGNAYRKGYGVDFNTAFTELEMLGVAIDPDYKERVLQSVANQAAARRRKKEERKAEQERLLGIESDEHFALIVGYTGGRATV